MSGLIKQQILKRLSKFTKNLSADQISLSAMKGEGDLTNLELDEIILMDLLGAPSWVKLTRAFCNRLTIKVQWTKLSSQPIILILDEVNIDMETCDCRDHMSENIFVSHSSGKYGYTEQIMDGMSLSINVININFRSHSFHATFQMSRVTVESRTPIWQVGSLDRTRIKNDLRGEVIIFKEIQWQAVRIEANALTDWNLTTPLRLIANQSKIRITLKKRMADCGIICTKVEVNMDDVLWVLTDSQVFAAMTFVNDLRNVIVNNQDTKVSVPPKSQSCSSALKSPSASHKTLSQRQLDVERFFNKLNESSYHFFTGRIELHLCDDISQESSSYRCRIEGGAMQLVLNQLEFSYYPRRPAGSSRQGWPKYNECNATVERWTQTLLSNYLKHKDIVDWHLRQFSKDVKQEILESCTVVRLKDLCLYCVSSSNDSKKSKPQKLFGSDKKRLLLPDDMPVIHVEFTNYFQSPIPSSLHVIINPVCLSVHHPSLLWINAFVLNVMKKSEKLPKRKLSEKQVDTKLEVLMPRMTFSASETPDPGRDEDLLQIHSSKLLITNLLLDDSNHKNSTRVLASQFQTYKSSKFCQFGFQCKNDNAFSPDTGGDGKQFQEISIPPLKYPHGFIDTITKSNTYLKKEEDGEMWCLVCDQFWIDFLTPNKQPSHPNSRKFKTQNFMESFPFTLWLLVSPNTVGGEVHPKRLEQNITCMMCIDVKVKILADCQQLNFLTRMMLLASKTYDEITLDAYRIGLTTPSVEIVATSLILLPQVELCLILPSPPMMSSSSSSSIPYASSSSSSLMSLSNRATELQNGSKRNASISSDEIAKSQATKFISKDDLLINGSDGREISSLRIEPHLNHFLELTSFESVRRQTKDTMSSMLSGISTKFRGSDSHIHDHVDDEEWVAMMLIDQSEIPAFERTKEIYEDNDYDDVISDFSSNKKRMISILSVTLNSLEILIEMNNNQLRAMMMIDNISTKEIEKINYEKFKSTYLLANNESIPLYPDDCSSNLSFFKFHYNVARVPELTDFRDNVHLEIQDCKLKLNSSTLLKIIKAFEGYDGISMNGSPYQDMLMNIFLRSIGIDIMDKDYNRKISIDSMQICKGEDGIIHVGSGDKRVNNSFEKDKEPSQDIAEFKLEHENETLKKQLEKLGKLTMCEHFDGDLNHWKERCRTLENEMKDMEVQVLHLTAERDSLLKIVDTLQIDLEFSEKMRNKPPNL